MDAITDNPFINKISSGSSGKMIITFFLLFIVVYVLIYVYQLYTSTSLKTTTMLKKPISIPYELTNITKDISIPKNISGNQYSMSLWIYVDEMSPTSNNKFIIGRGNGSQYKPSVYINNSNELCVDVGEPNGLKSPNFPTSRWVNIAVVVDETLAQLYIDGQFKEAKLSNSTYSSSSGNVHIGKSSHMERIQGYLSKIQLFNYALTIDHTKIIYKAGPLHKSILSMIGIPMYGLRNPFHRLDQVKVE
jgi:hypothetical protein